jgi:hypothetical protein
MKLNNRALATATLIGVALQLIMTTVGHANVGVRNLFAVVGMGISLVAGILYTVISTEVVTLDNVVGGTYAGAACAFPAIALSYFLHDVPASILIIGTALSAVTGALGGWLGRLFSSGRV